MSIRVEVRDITPEVAKIWLTKNKRNRTLNKNRVKKYAEEMKTGNWMEHHQGIAFYSDGSLADGQHRLAAIVYADVEVSMAVAWGVPEESGLMIDGHQPRTMNQSIKISGLADWIGKDEVAIARMMMNIEENKCNEGTTRTQIVNYCEFHKDALLFSCHVFGHKKRNITTALMMACIASAYYYEDKNRLSEFCTVLLSGMPRTQEDRAAILVREWLLESGAAMKGGMARLDGAKRIMRAVKAFCEHQDISKLYQPKEFIYVPATEKRD